MIQYKKLMMTLALLLTAVTGAWADEPKVYTTAVDVTSLKVGDILAQGFSLTSTNPNGAIFNIADQRGKRDETIHPGGYGGLYTKNITAYGANATFTTADGTYYPIDENGNVGNAWVVTQECNQLMDMDLIIAGVTIELPLKVTWNPATKTGTFTMPAFDVEIAPIYAPTAMFATDGNQVLTPTAAEGIYAESTDSIITPGKVAMMGETENPQGIVKYFATGDKNMTAAQAMAADGWLSELPTAAGYERDTTIYVWYYIAGADTPQGQEATAENTFNDSEICTTPIEVKILNNKFDIQFNAANANTIENGKATVTANGEQKTVTEGKLKSVKMGSKVTITAKEGYKFRKVEAKKKEKTYTITPRNARVSYNYGNLTNEATLPYNTTTSELMKKVGLTSVNNSYNIQSVSLTSGSNVTLGTPTGTPGQRGYEVPLTITGEGEFELTVGRTNNNNDAIIKVFVRANSDN